MSTAHPPLLELTQLRRIRRINSYGQRANGVSHQILFEDSTTLFVNQNWYNYWRPEVGGFVASAVREKQPGFPSAFLHIYFHNEVLPVMQPKEKTLLAALEQYAKPSPFAQFLINLRAFCIVNMRKLLPRLKGTWTE